MKQNGKEFLHPEVFGHVMAKWETLCRKNDAVPSASLWSPASRMVRIELQMATLEFLREHDIHGYV